MIGSTRSARSALLIALTLAAAAVPIGGARAEEAPPLPEARSVTTATEATTTDGKKVKHRERVRGTDQPFATE
jgi:hypothetical protein